MKKIYILLMAYILLSPCLLKAQLFDPSYHIGRHRVKKLVEEGFTIQGIKMDTIVISHTGSSGKAFQIFGKKIKMRSISQADTIEKDITFIDTYYQKYITIRLSKNATGQFNRVRMPGQYWSIDTVYITSMIKKNVSDFTQKDTTITVARKDILLNNSTHSKTLNKYIYHIKHVKTNDTIIYVELKDPKDRSGWGVNISNPTLMRFSMLKKHKTGGLLRELESLRNDDPGNDDYIYSNDTIAFSINPNQFIKINSFSWFLSTISLFYRTTPACLSGYTISSNAYTPNPTPGGSPYASTNYHWAQIGTGGSFAPFNLGPAFGVSWSNNCVGPQINQSEWALSLGIGVPFTVTQLSKEPLRDPYSISESEITSQLSDAYVSPSFVFGASSHGIGVIITFGWNYMIGQYCTDWVYDKHCYIGIGLGVTIAGGGSGGSSAGSGTGH